MPGTGGGYAAAYTGAGGMITIWGDITPVFTVGVTGSLTVSSVLGGNQYGYVWSTFPSYGFLGGYPGYQDILSTPDPC